MLNVRVTYRLLFLTNSAVCLCLSFTEKVKVCFGNMFIKFPKSKTKDMIQKGKRYTHTHMSFNNEKPISTLPSISLTQFISNHSVDQEQLDKEINNLRKELKDKVSHLNNLQGRFFFLFCKMFTIFFLSCVTSQRHRTKNRFVITLLMLNFIWLRLSCNFHLCLQVNLS